MNELLELATFVTGLRDRTGKELGAFCADNEINAHMWMILENGVGTLPILEYLDPGELSESLNLSSDDRDSMVALFDSAITAIKSRLIVGADSVSLSESAIEDIKSKYNID